jgi:hypothetical protein
MQSVPRAAQLDTVGTAPCALTSRKRAMAEATGHLNIQPGRYADWMVASRTAQAQYAILPPVVSDAINVAEQFEALAGLERLGLANREADNISVVLYWTRATNIVTVAVADLMTGDYFELVLSDDEPPLDVFYHPFAYARARGLELADEQEPEVALDALDA